MRITIFIILFFGLAQPLFAQQQEKEKFVKIMNRLVEEMNNQDYDGIVREYNKSMSVVFPLLKRLIFSKIILILMEKLLESIHCK